MTQEEIFEWFKKLPEYAKIVEVFGEYDPELAYAGPENDATLAALVPETAYGIDLNLAFYHHDGLYKIGGDKQARWVADMTMLSTGYFIIENTPDRWFLWGFNWSRRAAARRRLIKYWEAVRAQGHKHFNYTNKPQDITVT